MSTETMIGDGGSDEIKPERGDCGGAPAYIPTFGGPFDWKPICGGGDGP